MGLFTSGYPAEMRRYQKIALCFIVSARFVACSPADESATQEIHQAHLDYLKAVPPLNCNLGYVSAGSTVQHHFWIENDTSDAWQIAEAITTCSCTLPRLEKSAVAPGERLTVTVAYTAGQGSYDDKQSVTLLLTDTTKSPIVFTVQAKVRETLDLVPRIIGRQTVATGGRKTLPLTVESFGDLEISDFELVADSDWLHFETGPPTALDGNSGPKHRWKVQCIIDSNNLEPGAYTTTFQLRGGGFSKVYTMDLRVTAPIMAIPHRMFFDDLRQEGRPETTIAVRVDEQLSAADIYAEATFHMPRWLSVSAIIQGNSWKLTGTRIDIPDVTDGSAEIVIEFKQSRLPDLRIPVLVFCEDKL